MLQLAGVSDGAVMIVGAASVAVMTAADLSAETADSVPAVSESAVSTAGLYEGAAGDCLDNTAHLRRGAEYGMVRIAGVEME